MKDDLSFFDDMDEEEEKKESTETEETEETEEFDDDFGDENEELEQEDIFANIDVKDKKSKTTKTATTKTITSKPVVPKEPEFTGPRAVMVYGQELFIEENPKVTLEEMRIRIVNEFKFPEFSAERTHMSFDNKTGIIVPCIEFKKKG